MFKKYISLTVVLGLSQSPCTGKSCSYLIDDSETDGLSDNLILIVLKSCGYNLI